MEIYLNCKTPHFISEAVTLMPGINCLTESEWDSIKTNRWLIRLQRAMIVTDTPLKNIPAMDEPAETETAEPTQVEITVKKGKAKGK